MERRKFVLGGLAGLAALVWPRAAVASLETETTLPMIEIRAEDVGAYRVQAYLNGEDVSKECAGCFVPVEANKEAWGWVDLLVYNWQNEKDISTGQLRVNADGALVTRRVAGLVKWHPWSKKL